MKIQVLFFATFRSVTGIRDLQLDIPETTTVEELKHLLCEKFPRLAPIASTMVVSVNKEFASDQQILPVDGEVALFPPVSGGSFPTICLITEAELDLTALVQNITLPTTGAACIFSGIVRGVTTRSDPHQTLYLEYEAYQLMAEAKMRQVADEIRQRWPTVEGIALVQRVGRLEPGTPTVLIACSAPHRDTGVFEAARYGIDRLKEIVPVWKKEVTPQGESWVEGGYLPEPGE